MFSIHWKTTSLIAALGLVAATPGNATDKIELDYWVFSDFAQGEALKLQQAFIDEFKASHPGVTINIAGKGDDDLTAGEIAGTMSGDGPDVFMNATVAGAALVRAGALKNIYEDWMAMPEDFRDQFNKELISVCTPKPGAMYCLPYTGYGSFMFRNLKVLKEAGIDPNEKIKDWDHWLAQMAKISKTGKYAIPDETLVVNSVAEIYSGIADQNEWGADFDKNVTLINPEKFAKTAEMFIKMAPYASGTSRNDQATRDLFISGQLAFYITGPWFNPALEAAGMKLGVDYDWVLVPGASEGKYGGIKGHEFLAVAPNEHADIAWEFVAYVAEKKQMVRWASALGRYVSNEAALAEPSVAKHPLLAITNAATKQALFNRGPFFIKPFPNDYWSTITDKASSIVEGNLTPEEGAKELVEELNEILKDG